MSIPHIDFRKVLRTEWDREEKIRSEYKRQLLGRSGGRTAFACSLSTEGLWLRKQKREDTGRSCGKPLEMAIARPGCLAQHPVWKSTCSQTAGDGSQPSCHCQHACALLPWSSLCSKVLPDPSAPLGSGVPLLLFHSTDKWGCLQLPWGWLGTQQKRGRLGGNRMSRTSPAKRQDLRVVARSFPCLRASIIR